MELSDIASHNTKSDCWIVINNKVYDVTNYLDEHPGGSSIIIEGSGKDSTEEFNQIGHSKNAHDILTKYEIGHINKPPSFFQMVWNWIFPPQKEVDDSAVLIQRSQLTHDTIRLMFAVPRMDLKCAQYLVCSNGDLKRKYTPVNTTPNSFDLIVKVYDKGGMSAYMNSLRIGNKLTISEPIGNKIYLGNGSFSNLNIQARKIIMICAGTGITPIYNVLQKIMEDRENVCANVLYVNKTVDDILLRDELDNICVKTANIKVQYALTRVFEKPPILQGRPTKDMVLQLGECDLALICGPTEFNNHIVAICKELGYPAQVY